MDACQPLDPELHLIPVRTRDADDGIDVDVEDSGVGIPEALRGRIFEPMVTTKDEGTGLGLYISRRLVEEHHGVLGFRCKAEGGTVFTVHLPAEPDDDVEVLGPARAEQG